jgi:hypothetical protein
MVLLGLLWMGLVLGGLAASFWLSKPWRGTWFRLVRAPVPKRETGPVWQRVQLDPACAPRDWAGWPGTPVVTRAGPSRPPRSEPSGCDHLSAPPFRRARRD